MIISGPKTLAAAMCALLLMGSGCDLMHRKKPQPPPAIPPSIEKQPKIDLPNPQPTPPPTPQPTPAPTETAPPPKPKPKRTSKPKKTVVQPEPENTAPVTPAPAKPTPDTSINAPMTNADMQRQKERTSGLLGSAENNLANIHRSLSVDEQNMVSQIRNYIAQSRKAMTDGDLERAYNLANKANLLSTELVKE